MTVRQPEHAEPDSTRGFRFKQFFIAHDRCAMKVGTDSIMLGSWVNPGQAAQILDIGCGSGLLSIMMAQTSHADSNILGIDIDAGAVKQARQNASISPWPAKLSFECVAVQHLAEAAVYDLIITNPPYFPHQHAIEPARQAARLTAGLSYKELAAAVSRLLADKGRFCCILPQQQAEHFLSEAKALGLQLSSRMNVRSEPDKPISRVILEMSRSAPAQLRCQDLTIQQRPGQYSRDYRQLCRAFLSELLSL